MMAEGLAGWESSVETPDLPLHPTSGTAASEPQSEAVL